jgi:pimeloyl-ACP methyl ester carboxylesterase
MRSIIAFIILSLTLIATPIKAEEIIGILLMHGKGGSSSEASPVGKLIHTLEDNGFLVFAPDMPWSRERKYDKSFDESMLEIDDYIAELKKRGATKIVVGGHSMGANAALGYAARRDGLAAVLAIAPGHVPEINAVQEKLGHDWRRARKMVDAGKGAQPDEFNEINQGEGKKITMPAEVYLSWFDPDGPAVMPVNTSKLRPGTALLWIIGKGDRMFARGKDYAFDKAPAHPKNAYIVVEGGHKATPRKGESEIIAWLSGL